MRVYTELEYAKGYIEVLRDISNRIVEIFIKMCNKNTKMNMIKCKKENREENIKYYRDFTIEKEGIILE